MESSLVVFRARIGDAPPAERAARLVERVESLPVDLLEREVRAARATLGGLDGILITVGGFPILGILPQDVDPASTESLDELGQAVAGRLGEILRARRDQLNPQIVLHATLWSAGTAALTVLFIVAALRLRRFALRLGSKWTRRSLAVMGFDLRVFVGSVYSFAVNAVTVVAILVVVQSWLAFALTRFPYTRPWGEGLRSYLLGLVGQLALGALHAIPGLFAAAIILFAARFLSRGVGAFFEKVERGEIQLSWLESDTARATRRLVSALVWVFAVIAAYPYLPGSETEAFKGVSVFVGLMVSLGGVSFVNQIMSGLVVVYAKTFKIGDYVCVGEREGIVAEIGTLSTKIVTRAREEITVPNAVLVGSTVTNFTRLAGEVGSVVQTVVTIGYDAPWRQVHALLELAAERTKGVRREPKPMVLQRALSDFYVEYQLLVHIEEVNRRALVLSDLHANIQDTFNEYGVQILSPHFESQPEQKVVVPKQDWAPPPAGEGAPGGKASSSSPGGSPASND